MRQEIQGGLRVARFVYGRKRALTAYNVPL